MRKPLCDTINVFCISIMFLVRDWNTSISSLLVPYFLPKELTKLSGIIRLKTTPYHLKIKVIIERKRLSSPTEFFTEEKMDICWKWFYQRFTKIYFQHFIILLQIISNLRKAENFQVDSSAESLGCGDLNILINFLLKNKF